MWLFALCLLLPLTALAAGGGGDSHGEAPKKAEKTFETPPANAPKSADVKELDTPTEIQKIETPRDYSSSEIKLLQELEDRRTELERREQALDLRERLADLAEQKVAERVVKLENLQKSIESLLKNMSGKEDEELVQLAKIYESMKPAAAAGVLDKLDNAIVYDLFRRMKQKTSAKIMEKMSPPKVRVITEMLAEQKDLPSLP